MRSCPYAPGVTITKDPSWELGEFLVDECDMTFGQPL